MKKATMLIMMLLVAVTFAQTFPEISTEGNETWYYIQFERGSGSNYGVIQDMGEGENLLTKQARENTDSQLWKVTGTTNNYVITNKLGRSIGFSGSLFTATASETSAISFSIITSSSTTYTGLELQRNASSSGMNQNGGGGFERTLGEWVLGDQGNVLNFRLPEDVAGGLQPALTSPLPELNTWYYVKFRGGHGVLQDMGDGNLLKTAIPIESDAQLWKVTGNVGDFTLTSKNGNSIDWDGTNFISNSSSTLKLNLVENVPGWEIQRVGSSHAMNQQNNRGYDKALGEWVIGDSGNPVDFIFPEDITLGPKISGIDGNDYWYQLQFNSGSGVIEDKGEEAKLLTAEASPQTDTKLWKVTGTPNNLVFTNKASGRVIAFNGTSERFIASATGEVGFKIIPNSNGELFNLQREGTSSGINQFGGGGLAKELGEWVVNDKNNLISFVWKSSTLRVSKFNGNDIFKVYPNPFNHYFHCDFKNTVSTEASFKVYSIQGNVLKFGVLPVLNGMITIDGRDLSSGLYLVEIELQEGKSSFKIVKQ